MSNVVRSPSYGAVAITLSLALCLCASIPALGADVSIKPGDKVITLDIQNQAQLDLVLDMNLDVWSHGAGIGPVDVHVSVAERQAIDAAGLTYTVAIDDLVAVHAASLGGPQPHGTGFFDDYHDLDELVTFINDLATARPDLAEVFSIGQSVEGRDIWVLHVTGPEAGPKPGVFYHALQHAREWITGPTVLYLAEHLINNYDT
ncbi:MAG: M14 family carboxypeptidase A/B, partial [Planctomycetota bacterium]|nr:M14 family carboxypeptidase A/B [Planctomycetota bacterium]